jgi:GT2 family glycosyltransferase/3'-phosphoadenosine 5'-phosphosulfate sulfotransferase (PAPS reductase)/FAD synthetase
MHRSGTSAVARSVSLLGPYMGNREQLMPPVAGDNPLGFWEHRSVYSFHERLLSHLCSSWDSILPLPEGWWKRPEIISYREELKRLIRENFGGRCLWMWKDPRTSLMLPLWKDIAQELAIEVNYVICVRNPLDVAASLKRRNHFAKHKSLSLWHLYNASSLHWTNDSKRLVLHYDALLENWEPLIKRVSTIFEIPWPQDEDGFRKSIVAFLNPNERHTHSDDEAVFNDCDVAGPTAKLYRLLLDMTSKYEISVSQVVVKKITSFYHDYCAYSRLFAPVLQDGCDHFSPAFAKGEDTKGKKLESGALSIEVLHAGEPPELIFPAFSNCMVSIIIPVLNHWEYTQRCLQSVLANTHEVSYEVIVVDNGSSDCTEEQLSRVKGITVIRNERNEGYGQANNQAALQAKGEYLMFLNNDTEPLQGWLSELVSSAEAIPEAGAVGAKLIYPDGKLQEAGGVIFSDGYSLTFGTGDSPDEEIYNVMCEVDYCSGASLLVRKRLFVALGGFDRRYALAYHEDTDLGFSLRKMGYKVIYNPHAVVVHYKSATALSSSVSHYYEINRRRFVEKWKDELAGQDTNPIETGSPPVTACRERLRGENLLPEDILDRLDKRRVGRGHYPASLVSDISLLYPTLNEKTLKSHEVIKKAASFYGRDGLGILWTGSEDSVAVLHMVRQAFGGALPFRVINMVSSLELREEDGLFGRLAEEWGFDPVNLTREWETIQHPAPDGHLVRERFDELAIREVVETMRFKALILANRCDDRVVQPKYLYFARETSPPFMCVQPILHFRGADVWHYIKKYDLPFSEVTSAGSRMIFPVADGQTYAGLNIFLSEFKAVISVDDAPSALAAHTATSIRVRVTNQSSVLWPAQENTEGGYVVSLSYHWIDKNGTYILFDGIRTPLPRGVVPGGDIVLDAAVVTPSQPGEYSLEFDMVQEGISWFKDRGSAIANITINVVN